jgi:hypothetical protein
MGLARKQEALNRTLYDRYHKCINRKSGLQQLLATFIAIAQFERNLCNKSANDRSFSI